MSPERFVKGESERTVFNGLDSFLKSFLRNPQISVLAK